MKGYKEVFIKNLNLNNPKVSVSGIIVGKEDGSLVLDDNFGVLQIEIESEFNIGDYVRVFGNLIEIEEKLILKGDFVQDLNKINKELHRKVKGLL